jgi:hypothetical protein
MGAPPEALIIRELWGYGIQGVLLALILYNAYTRGKTTIFKAFTAYTIYLSLHIVARAMQVGFVDLNNPDALELFSHVFKAAFFLIMGYVFLDALITDKVLKRILKSNTYVAILLLVVIALGILIVEGQDFVFMDTVKELVYEIVEVTVIIMIINILIHSWMDTRAKNLLLVATAFILYLLADAAHIYSLVWGFSELEYVVRHLLRLGALAILTYSMLVYKR